MAQSARFKALNTQVDQLEKRLIPKIRPTGKYTPRENDLIRSYRLLVHAEFESYFEDRAIEIADRSLAEFLKSGRTNIVIAALMAFSPLTPQSPPSSLNKISQIEIPVARVQKIVGHFRKSIREGNHGIKEKNIISIFLPIGLPVAALDPTFLNTLNSYGASRGASAHQSVRTQAPIDPATETRTVSDLLKEIAKLDLHIQLLRR